MRTKTATWFEAKVRYHKTLENGTEKLVTDLIVVDAMSFTEAEKRVIEYIEPFVTGEYNIMTLAKASYKEVVFVENEKADKYFKCKVNFIVIDEKTAQEKKSATMYLVQAMDIEDANKNITSLMDGGMLSFEVPNVNETKVLDVVEAE